MTKKQLKIDQGQRFGYSHCMGGVYGEKKSQERANPGRVKKWSPHGKSQSKAENGARVCLQGKRQQAEHAQKGQTPQNREMGESLEVAARRAGVH